MSISLKILILEDSAEDVSLMERELKRSGIEFMSKVVKTRQDYESGIHKFNPDVILSDHSLPQFNSIEAMKIWKEHRLAAGLMIPFRLITVPVFHSLRLHLQFSNIECKTNKLAGSVLVIFLNNDP